MGNLMEATNEFKTRMSAVEDKLAERMSPSMFRNMDEDTLRLVRRLIYAYDAAVELIVAQSEAINEILEKSRRWEEKSKS